MTCNRDTCRRAWLTTGLVAILSVGFAVALTASAQEPGRQSEAAADREECVPRPGARVGRFGRHMSKVMSIFCGREVVLGAMAFCVSIAVHAEDALLTLKVSRPVVAPQSATIATKGYVVQEIRDRLYWLSDGAYNTMFVVSSEGVIAIDPLPTLGANYLKAIAEVTDKPVTHVIYSHEHTDHIGAAYLFPKGATYIAQNETAKLLASRNDPRRPFPTLTFDDTYTLTVGDQTLVLDYKGVNHEAGNIFIYAPKQKVLMLVDVVYPGYMPYPNLGIAVDVPGYLKAHRDALTYDFDTLVAGHVDRLGTRKDVEVSLDFAAELQRVTARQLVESPFPTYLQQHPGENKWFMHDAYERQLVDRCYAELLPKWQERLAGAVLTLKSQCWSMIVALVVQTPPVESSLPTQVERSASKR